MTHLTNFSFEFFSEIFTEDASLLFYTMVQKSQKWPKTQIKGSCLNTKIYHFAWFIFQIGLENLFCASRRIFRVEPRRHFSGRIFFHLGRNRAPRLKSLGAKKREAIFEAGFCTYPNTNIISETDSKFPFFLAMKIDGKQKKKDLLERSWAHFILSWNPERKG